LSEHLKNVTQAMELKSRPVTLAVGVNDSIVRQTEMPLMPVEDMRMILKNNTKIYLQQDLPGYIFDCHIIPPRMPAKPPEKGQGGSNIPKSKVLAAGAKQQYLQDLQTAIRSAGLTAETILPAMLGPVNAFEMAMPESFGKEVVALVDIGFRN